MNQIPQVKVSVITVSFNAESTLTDCIRSVLNQCYENIEYIVVDGGSNDGTVDILKQFSNDIDVVVSEKDHGIYDAMNKGVKIASGDVITFLNSDDSFSHAGVVKEAIELMCSKAGTELVFGDVQFFNDVKLVRHYSSARFKPWKLRFGWMPPHPGSFAKASLYERYGYFNLSYKISADYDLFVRWLYVNKVSYLRLDDVLVHMSMGGVSTRSLKSRLLLNSEIIRSCRSHGLYTNFLMLALKIPFKVKELFFLPSRGNGVSK